MLDATTEQVLQDVLRAETRSVLHYVEDAFPWTAAGGEEAVGKLRALIREEMDATADLGRYLFRHHVPPLPSGMYPASFTTLNFVSLQHLLPRLIDYEAKSADRLREVLPTVPDPEAKHLLGSLVALKERHSDELRQLQNVSTEPAVKT